ncbi:hypothetical protein RFI_05382 [Reticulomyxa filosa]|uniref:Matrin-type domain-containing protein n=1 Tax=Reticulomyxa filosa TaxID=46433 RepID=X6P2F0_RETFI|nr:hypothetical protein RFI_05382 [Reticulomyxa filosa]|eukprot:ETO31737.1 hypothetical protein RFI_05382 [Reticulomyxa filosa]
MSNSRLERLRWLHSAIEAAKEDVVGDLQSEEVANSRQQLHQDHRMQEGLTNVVTYAKEIALLYEDKDKKLRDEIEDMSCRSYLNVFYSRLSDIRRYHKANPNIFVPREILPLERGAKLKRKRTDKTPQKKKKKKKKHMKLAEVEFTGEEWHGRYVDMNGLYTQYINLAVFRGVSMMKRKIQVMEPDPIELAKCTPYEIARNIGNVKMVERIVEETVPLDYKTFLFRFQEFWRISNSKKAKPYQQFYEKVLDYLVSFFKRTRPLAPTDKILSKCEEIFEQKWKERKVEGWQRPWTEDTKKKWTNELPVAALSANENVEKGGVDGGGNGSDSAANATMSVGITSVEKKKVNKKNTGGNANANANTNANANINANANANANADTNINTNINANNTNGKEKESEKEKEPKAFCFMCDRAFDNANVLKYHMLSKKCVDKKPIALLETKVQLFAELLEDNINATRDYLDKKQTMTYAEIRREMFESTNEQIITETMEFPENDEDAIENLNPKNVPLDFDGKPIPYWLFKFRQLNRSFRCNVCGGVEYRGPRAFERHFREWRHAHNMRKLGIPNTKDYHMITEREDAKALCDKLKREKVQLSWNPSEEEEFEDNDGNVFNKCTFEQLKRQGVI